MKNKMIGYVTFGKDDFGYGMAYVLSKSGLRAQRATIKTARYFDVICFSIFWWAHVYRFYDFCVRAGIGYSNEKPRIIVGGFNTFNPDVFFPLAHQVVVGDGETVFKAAIKGEAHPSIYTGIEKDLIYNHCDISDNSFCYRSSEITRIEIARGCKYKCPYCQLAFLKPYREVELSAIRRAIDQVATKRVALFAPNGGSHTHYKQITELASRRGLSNVASDVRYNEMKIYNNDNTARTGIEGISERLRRSIKKPISDKAFLDLVKLRMAQCEKRGTRPALHTYFILDLPGEDNSDWKAFDDLLQKVDSLPGIENFTWIITGNVFMPGPHTPLESASIHIERDYKQIWRAALSDRTRAKKYRFTLTGRHSVFSPYSRALSMIATRGGNEAGEIIYNLVANERLKKASMGTWSKSLRALRRFLEHYGGIERYIGEISNGPWKKVRVK
jgi:radical SAM superfamily enzyme YgiQ (UPF0313 family)